MNRQLFIHHYLPAHLCSALVAGAVFNFILSESINYPISVPSSLTRLRPRLYSDLGIKALAALLVFNVVFIGVFFFLSPLTYGTPGWAFSCSSMQLADAYGTGSMETKSTAVESYPHGRYISP